MGTVAKVYGVLKLVHPGRYVEIHKEPITAAAVLKRNPRHSITRSDVFQYPWVVARPESVLKLGKVFFIVPNHTIYQLLKDHEERHQHSPPKSHPPKKHVQQEVQYQNSKQKSDGVIMKHQNNHRWLKQSLPMPSCIGTTSQEQDFDKRLRKQSKVEPWPRLLSKNSKTFPEIEQKSEEDSTKSTTKTKSSLHKEYHLVDNKVRAELPNKNDGDLECTYRKEATMLKSCLRKQDSVRNLLQLRVSFFLPVKDEEQQRRVKVSQTQFASHYSYISSDFFVHSTNLVPA